MCDSRSNICNTSKVGRKRKVSTRRPKNPYQDGVSKLLTNVGKASSILTNSSLAKKMFRLKYEETEARYLAYFQSILENTSFVDRGHFVTVFDNSNDCHIRWGPLTQFFHIAFCVKFVSLQAKSMDLYL